jgi:membrane protease YdiL (CAAX protease family)
MEQPPLDNIPAEPPPPQTDEAPLSPPFDTAQDKPKPAAWTANDTWLGLGLLLVLVGVYFAVIFLLGESQNLGIFVVATFEFILLIPIAVVFLVRKAAWTELGLRPFKRNDLALGCGLLAAVYIVVIVNNLVMIALGVVTQADVVSDLLGELDAPILFAFVTAIVAPFTEELFFRGFLFKGFRQKYGWVRALLISSAIFALFHGQVATLIPTFLLGALFAYLYQRTESVFPGMILHFTVNSMGACILLAASQFGIV